MAAAAAAKILLSPPHPLPSRLNTAKFIRHHQHHQPLAGHARPQPKRMVVLRASLQEHLSSSSVLMTQLHRYHQNQDSMYLLAESVGYSLASYYTSLGLFVISVPGLWSLIKRSVKSKIVQKTFIGEEGKKAPNQVAGEIFSFFTRNNFVVTDRGETITHDGAQQRTSRIAYFLHLHQSSERCSCAYNYLSRLWQQLVLDHHFKSIGRSILLEASVEKGADKGQNVGRR